MPRGVTLVPLTEPGPLLSNYFSVTVLRHFQVTGAVTSRPHELWTRTRTRNLS